MLPEAVLATLFVLAANTLLRPVVNRINRQPMGELFTEATYSVHVVCQRALQADLREKPWNGWVQRITPCEILSSMQQTMAK